MTQHSSQSTRCESGNPGAIYPPGSYPTPELTMFALGKSDILTEGPNTSATIQKALDNLGPSSTLYLPPGSVWDVHDTIFLHEYQEIATLGYPTQESELALLQATKVLKKYLIQGFGKSGVRIRNLAFDGGREKYGWSADCGVMVLMGQTAVHQVVDRCVIRHPRNWSCIQAFEGSQNVRFTNNIIGPAGKDESNRWADGISFAGTDGLVAGNHIIDGTDGGIVIFGAPGSLITSNTITTKSQVCLNAIAMVDWQPHKGNYTWTRVLHNTIEVEGSYVKCGIAQGPRAFSHNGDGVINSGAIVMNNLITSSGTSTGSMGYGFPLVDVANWTTLGNVSAPSVKYEGDISRTLPNLLATPAAFVFDQPLKDNVVKQKEYVRGRISYLLAVQPGRTPIRAFGPGEFRLRVNESFSLSKVRISFDEDGDVRIRKLPGGEPLWEMGLKGKDLGHDPLFIFDGIGRLRITDHTGAVKHDCAPHAPPHDPQDHVTGVPTIRISEEAPYLALANPVGSILFASHYIDRMGQEMRNGHYVCRPLPDGRVLIWTLSPYCQWLTLRSKLPHQKLNTVPVTWPLDRNQWEVVWSTPNKPREQPDPKTFLAFQGDGNIVIYGTEPGARWASGTHARQPPAKYVKYGIGTEADPFVQILDEQQKRIWHS
ncbi:hypothetical protein SISNIDRAFT_442200 [Sistotremastrum niveocremeum HHB9708]|uniref:Uncharacterized protein n=1 Tax=Sistotremastrum niveocremeum HHB9708 TaxID=1314777 RepID=A0A164TK11_9AGAM|nr:hypothetical protein SISNIDRAFT_442200 [Sistotremastrum niveocremeum HHB9708]